MNRAKYLGVTRTNSFWDSGIFKPGIYAYQREVTAVQDFPISATIFTLGVGMAPSLSLKVSDKVFLDLKIIPSFLLADFEKVTIQVRYLMKEPKKRRRSRA